MIRNPYSAAVLLFALLLFALPAIGRMWHPRPPVYAVREVIGDGAKVVRIIDPDKQSWDELAKLSQDRPDDCATVFWTEIGPGRRGGLIEPMVASHRPLISTFGKAFSSEDIRLTHLALAPWLDEFGATDKAELLRRSDTWSIWWPGVFKNAFSLLVVGVVVWSWGWIFEVDSWRRQRRRDRGLCGECAYDLRATKMDDTGSLLCPECGTLNPPNTAPLAHS